MALMGATAVALAGCRSARVDKTAAGDEPNWSVSKDIDGSYLVLSDALREMVGQNNDFAFNLFRKTMGMDSRVISPLSVTYLMSMLANGAGGDTQQQVLATLGWAGKGQNQPTLRNINEFSRMMMEKAGHMDRDVKVNIANYVAVNNRFKVNGEFQKTVERNYKAGVESLDFTSPKTLKRINGWCSDQTHGMIPSIIDQVDPQAVSYLMNAIYFNGTWADKFDKKQTKVEPFRGYTRDMKRVNMMHRHDDYYYADGEGYQVEQPLNDVISELGAPLIFTPQADFRQFASGQFSVSKMLQKAKIEVSEEGTKASAVTAAIMCMSLMQPEAKRSVVFHADRPFAYIISERSTGNIFFMGQFTGE
mgnify:CR=1 FL=1